MTLLDPRYLVLVAVSWLAFFSVPPRFRPHVLTGSGLVFYTLYAPIAGCLAAALVVFTHLLTREPGRRSTAIAVVICVGLLAYYKWPRGFVIAGADLADVRSGGPLVPLGLSFLALELIHYAVERRRGRIRSGTLLDLAAFAFFFPCRMAGPIKRFNDFTASVLSAERSSDNISEGCLRIVGGILKKVALADVLGRKAATIALAATPLEAWTVMVAYSLQLYLDFSAYSDIAIGVSRLMGIRVPENFRWPYASPNIQDFWNRWHMSLSWWAREYVLMVFGRALFKRRWNATVIASVCYLATFLVVGAWHGLTASFLVWGAYHGLLTASFHFYKTVLPVRIAASPIYQSRAAAWGGAAVTFVLVTIGWVFFRMDLPGAIRVLSLMLSWR